jgi:hypothetical protein
VIERGGFGSGRATKIAAPLVLCLLVLVVGFIAGRQFLSMRQKDMLFPSPGVTASRLLSDYFPGLKKTPGDTPVYVFEGREQGGRILILGGTHPNEPAGYITAICLAENIRAVKGTIVIIPWANASGFTHSDPQEGSPQRFNIRTASGDRWFRLGSRVTNPVHQWPDPIIYVNPMGQTLAGMEARNLNRAYPGKADGNLTERIAFGIMEVIKKERITLGIDLHESAPEYPVIDAIVFHENSSDLAAVAQMELQAEGLDFRLEASPLNLRGLSHREWGDAAKIKAILLETPNASHGRLKGKPTVALIIDGKDKFYEKAYRLGRLFVPYGPEGIPLKDRVARHLAALKSIFAGLKELEPDKAVEVENIPAPNDVREKGLGAFLR